MYLFLFNRRQETASGSHTPQGWWPILGPQCNMSGQQMVNILKKALEKDYKTS
uniref:ORF3 n=1 Tax=Rodent Torque teno virus 1 TaxID=1514664 RepID=X2GD17_9VIRU|nr:ORF3 [Rodent Torque teno virus 1]